MQKDLSLLPLGKHFEIAPHTEVILVICMINLRAKVVYDAAIPTIVTTFRNPNFQARFYSTRSTAAGKNPSANNLSKANNLSREISKDIMLSIPWFVTGFADGEGCFWINIFRDKSFKTGWRVKLFFQINLNKKDYVLLEQIQNYFGAGKIYKNKNSDSIQYLVTSVKDLLLIQKHFDKYPLHTKKRADFELWKKAFDLIQNKEHLTTQGLQKIVAIKASLNLGLSNEFKAAFSYNCSCSET